MQLDQLIGAFDRALRTLAAPARSTRPSPGSAAPETQLSTEERRLAIGLMRVNHCGEVCAQALYQGQALTSRQPAVRAALQEAAAEETEHLAWTEQRLQQLGGRTSLLNPLWYIGSLGLGIGAGILGDRWSLGFLAATERQVEAHLASHLERLPADDLRSRAIVTQMRSDEAHHADMAEAYGAATLPSSVQSAMRAMAGVMTRIAHHI